MSKINYTIKEDKQGFTPGIVDSDGNFTPLSEPKPNMVIARWFLDSYAKGSNTSVSEVMHNYTPNSNKKIPLHD